MIHKQTLQASVFTLSALFLVLLGPLGPAAAAVNEWELVGPPGGLISALAVDPFHPDTVYVGTNGGLQIPGNIYKSTNGGASWTVIHTPADTQVYTITADPHTSGTLWASGRSFSAKSTDGGASWSTNASFSGLPIGCSSGGFIIDPQVSTTIYTVPTAIDASERCGVHKSLDGGATWTAANTGLDEPDVAALVIDPTNSRTLYTLARSSEQNGKIYKSLNGGDTWTLVGTIVTPSNFQRIWTTLAIQPHTPTVLYAGASSAPPHFYKSLDGGVTWSPSDTGLALSGVYITITFITPDPNHPTTVYAGAAARPNRNFIGRGLGGLWKSTDGGATWTRIFTLANPSRFAIDPRNPNTFYLTTSTPFDAAESGVYKSTDGGVTWTVMDQGITAHAVVALVLDPTNPATIYANSLHSGLFRSPDQGGTWSPLGVLADIQSIGPAIDPSNNQILYIGGCCDGAGMYKSEDSGLTWRNINQGIPAGERLVRNIVIDPNNPATVYVAIGNRGLFKSIDRGENWTNIFPISSPSPHPGITVALDPSNPNTLYAAVSGQGVFKSTDGGGSWAASSNGLSASVITNLLFVKVSPSDPQTIFTGNGFSSLETFKSTDGGATWAELTGLHGFVIRNLELDPLDPTILYVGHFRSADGGLTLKAIDQNFASRWVTAIDRQQPSLLYVAGQYDPNHAPAKYRGAGVNRLLLTPLLECLSPLSGNPGDTVTITGQFFRPTQRTSMVTFNGMPAEVVSWSDAQIQVRVPESATTGPVEITLLGDPRTRSVVQPSPSCQTLPPGATTATFTVLTLPVAIDIKPGSFPNSINLGSGGTVPVAIFSTSTFDARTVDPLTVTLASAPVQMKGKGTPMASQQDVNGDGLLDLVVHVSTETLQLSETDTQAELTGKTFSGQSIRGTDSVRVVP